MGDNLISHLNKGQGADVGFDEEWVRGWCQRAEVPSYEQWESETDDLTPVDQTAVRFVVGPTTPRRRASELLRYEEVSPTSTNFSNDTIFDRSEIQYKPSSQDPFRDDVSDATTVDEEARCWGSKANANILNAIASRSRATSLLPYEPPSKIDKSLDDNPVGLGESQPVPATPPTNPGGPRITCIVSCLQCTVANLPCSRTTPACSRCERAGNGNLCLLYRRKYREEIELSSAQTSTVPVLLKLQDEDPGIWLEKLSLAEEVR